MNRKQRRSQQKKHGAELVRSRIERNGITVKDLEDAQRRGRAETDIETQMYIYKICFAASLLALHKEFKFGQKRGVRFLKSMYDIAFDTIAAKEIQDKVLEELGIELDFSGFDDTVTAVKKNIKNWEF